jgi:hypothetical protein
MHKVVLAVSLTAVAALTMIQSSSAQVTVRVDPQLQRQLRDQQEWRVLRDPIYVVDPNSPQPTENGAIARAVLMAARLATAVASGWAAQADSQPVLQTGSYSSLVDVGDLLFDKDT